ncbi:MAG: 8-amino-7-oxononanoate synthase [Thermodesulfobacteriota bacterium]
MTATILKELKGLEEAGLKRETTLIEKTHGPKVLIDGREVVLLCSNDYLGLSCHPEVKEAAVKAVERYGVGAGASRLVSGTMEPHIELEETVRKFQGTEAALVFNSGWHANTGLIPALAGHGDEIFSDKLSHASIIDGSALSRAKVRRYPHLDTDALEGFLKNSTARKKLIITEGIFSMDGDLAPLKDIAGLADRYGAMLYVDDAHGVGVLGENGTGTLEHTGVEGPHIVRMGTFGKALGTFGAFIAGDKELMELLVTRARAFVYSTALPPAVCAATIKAMEIVEREPERRARLLDYADYIRGELKGAGLDTLDSEAHIIPLKTGDAQRTMEITARLLDKGVFVQGIRPPTVPEGTSRLRITPTAAHAREEIDLALSAIKEALG